MADNPSLDNNEDLADIEAMLRNLDVDDLEIHEPPVEVWTGIEQALADESDSQTPSTNVPQAAPAPDSNVVSLADRRRMRFLAPAMGIAAAAVLAVAGVVVFSRGDDSSGDVVASAELAFDSATFDPLGATSSAAVSLVDADDHYEIAIDESELPVDLSEPADLELWLIEPDENGNVVDLVSLGIVEDVDQPFVVPDGYDPSVYKVVDISVEPHDGNHDHSGRSILRGALVDA